MSSVFACLISRLSAGDKLHLKDSNFSICPFFTWSRAGWSVNIDVNWYQRQLSQCLYALTPPVPVPIPLSGWPLGRHRRPGNRIPTPLSVCILSYISASLSFKPIHSEMQFFLLFFCLLFPSFTLPALCVAGFYCKSPLIVICVQTPLTFVHWADSKNLS